MRTACFAIVALFAIVTVTTAQSTHGFRRHFLEETVREMQRVSLDAGPEAAAARQAAARRAAAGVIGGGARADRRERLEKRGIGGTDATLDEWTETVVSNDLYPESEVHAVLNPARPGNIAVSPIRQQVYQGQIADLTCPVYYTLDDGASWETSTFLNSPSDPSVLTIGGGDPVLAAADDGTLYFSWLAFYLPSTFDRLISELYWVYSTDGGMNWVRPEKDVIARADMPINGGVQHFVDKQWLAVDRSTGPARGSLYAAFLRVADSKMRIALRRKPAGEARFTTEDVSISPESHVVVQFTSIDVDAVGTVHVTWFGSADEEHFSLWHARSTDAGASFSEAKKISDLIFPKFSIEDRMGEIPGMSTQRIYPCPNIVADRGKHPGHLYMTWTANGIDAKEGNGTDIYFTRSIDGGDSWETPRIINDDDKGLVRDQFHPSIAVNAQGVVAVTWYDRREDPENESARYYISVSRDGGASFLPSRPVAALPMDMYRAMEENGEFGIGEYTQILLTDTEAIPFWSDGRTNDGNIDVYCARMSLATLDVREVAPLSAGFRITDAYPAPASGQLRLVLTFTRDTESRILICDLLGRVLLEHAQQFSAGSQEVALDVSGLPSGSYQAVLRTESGTASRLIQITR